MNKLGRIDQWRAPQLPVSPAAAIGLAQEQARQLAYSQHADVSEITVIGSSLGGFYAIALAEQFGCKAILLNPAVHAPRDLATQVGSHVTYHSQEPMTFHADYVQELAAMAPEGITAPHRYLLLAATGDEVLDWREMVDFLPGAKHLVIAGSDHGLSDFEQYLPQVLSFAGITGLLGSE
jgi:uncharacterized protein